MKKSLIFLIISILAVFSAYGVWKQFASSQHPEIRISTNPWIGFTPFMYAQEKGWLEETPFKFIWLVDLSDNVRLFERGFVDGFTATQYELARFNNNREITAAFLIDQSDGADAILSNRSLEQLRQTTEKINVYLEMGSLNQDMFTAFIRENNMDKSAFVLIDSSQKSMEILENSQHPLVVITYEPYVSQMKRKGLEVIASTRTLKTFHVIDALFVKKNSLEEHADDYRRLKDIFKRAQKQLHQNPREYYETIAGYLEGESYEEFIASSHGIKWIGEDIPAPVMETLSKQHINTMGLTK